MDVIDFIASQDQMLTTSEVSQLLGIGQDTLMRWVRRGYITACRFKNFNIFNPAQLAEELRAAQRSSPDGSVAGGMQPDEIPGTVPSGRNSEPMRAECEVVKDRSHCSGASVILAVQIGFEPGRGHDR